MNIKWSSLLIAVSVSCATVSVAQITSSYQVGPLPGGGFAVPTNQVVTPAGTQLNFIGRPLAIALRPDHKTAAILNTGSGENNFTTAPIVIIDLTNNTVKQQFQPSNTRAAYDGVIYSADGNHLYCSQDNGTVTVLNVGTDGTVTADAEVALPTSSRANVYHPGNMTESRLSYGILSPHIV
jgi:hypothetical protein